ncbi:hypothetical protein PPMP20_08615 [Paraburkholderia phymatum]|uniref:hypothetical protein n=1 Tax=Paraburkholderia phymatum TaxID=148447 RepID=UPI0012FD1DA9|nr:hypothetical protein [Paraburkholderia phymatum]
MRSKGARRYYFFDADHVNIIVPLELKAERLSFCRSVRDAARAVAQCGVVSQIIRRAH